MIKLPEKKLLALVIILSLVGPAHYAMNFLNPPEGKVFVGYFDDAYILNIMKSPLHNFSDPWSFDGGKIWHNPLAGSVYLFLVLGFIPALLGVDLYLAFILFKFVFALAYYLIAYNLILHFIREKQHQRIAFLIFMLFAGIGGIIYIAASLLFAQSQYLPVIGYAFTREFDELAAVAHSLTHIFRLYYVIPEALGYLSLLLFINKKKILTGLALGLVFLFYPMHGFGFSVVLLLYSLAKNYSTILRSVRTSIIELLPVYIISSLFLVPWLVHYSERPYYFATSKLVFEALPALNLVVSFFFSGIFVLYYLARKPSNLMKSRKFVSLFLAALVFFSIQGMNFAALTSPMFASWLQAMGLLTVVTYLASLSVLIELAMAILTAILLFSVLREKSDADKKFLVMWSILFFVLSGVTAADIGYVINPVRLAPSLIFPVSVLAAYGVVMFSERFNLSPLKVVVLCILLSMPSIFGYNLWLQKSVRDSGVVAFYTHDEYDALKFLQSQPDGRVMSSLRYGAYIPYYSNKDAFLFSGRTYPGLLEEVNKVSSEFYAGQTSAARRGEMLDKYNISYVLVGQKEKGIEMPQSFKKVRSGETEIYRRTR